MHALFNPRPLVLGIGFLVILGLSATQTLPRLEDPSFVIRTAIIVTPYPGADAERVEALVTRPVEDALRGLAEVTTLTSTSRAGTSIVTVEVDDRILDVAPVWSRLRDELGEVARTLPEGAGEPALDDRRAGAYTLLAALVWEAEGVPTNPLILRRWGEALEDRLRDVPGTAHVALTGVSRETIEVELDPIALAAAGLSADAVAAALAAADAKQAAGGLTGPEGRLTVELSGGFDALDRVRAVPIAVADGRTLRGGDLASLRRGVVDPPDQLAIFGGRDAVVVAARMETGQRVDLWVERAQAAVAALGAELPSGIGAEIVFEQARYTADRLATVGGNLALGLVIVVAILFVTMGWRSALLVGLAVPLTALLTLALFRPFGLQIDQMSITGMIVALGMLVDNAIVMTNAIRERLRGGTPIAASVAGAMRSLWLPLLASTVTTILAFMPIVLLPGAAGEFVGPLAIAVILALVSSFAIALLFVPALAPLLLGRGGARPNGRGRFLADGLSPGALVRPYRRVLGWALERPAVAIAAALALPVIGIASVPTIPLAFFPPAERDRFEITMRLPAAASIDRTGRLMRQANALVRAEAGVRDAAWFAGTAAPAIYYNMVGSEDSNPAFLHALVETESVEATARLVPQLQRALDRAFPAAMSLVAAFEQGPPFAAPIELRLFGPQLDTLAELGAELGAIVAATPQITHTRLALDRDTPKLVFDLAEEDLHLAGLDPARVAGQLDAALAGRAGGFVLEGTEQLPVRVVYPPSWRADPARLAGLPLSGTGAAAAPGGMGVPLAAVSTLDLVPAWSAIARRDGERVQSVLGWLEAGVLPAAALARIEARIAESGFALPPGYRLQIGGEAEERGEAVTGLLASVAILAVLMLGTVALAFNSFRRTAIVMAAAVQTLGLGLLALKLSGYPFGFVVIVGVMGLVGVAINATIIILSAFDADPRVRAGDRAAMVEILSGPTSRHIWSTTITTVAGFLPLILGGGLFWPPFAVAFAGGLMMATTIAFLFTPAAYRLLAAPKAAPRTPAPTPAPTPGPTPGPASAVTSAASAPM